MPTILCIETSSAICSVAIIHQGAIYTSKSTKSQAHAEILANLIQDNLKDAGIQIKDLQAIAISEGPGSYTGLRIGTSTAKGLCFALGIPLIPISTLKIIARAALEMGEWELIWPMMDARRMEVYHCVFNRQLNALSTVENGIITDEGFRPAIVTNDTLLCGDGAPKASEILHLPVADVHADAATMCLLAEDMYIAGKFADLEGFEPFYLKQANITSSKK